MGIIWKQKWLKSHGFIRPSWLLKVIRYVWDLVSSFPTWTGRFSRIKDKHNIYIWEVLEMN